MSGDSKEADKISTGGGANIGGDVNTGGGHFIGRDKVTTAGDRSVAIGGNAIDNTIVTENVNVTTVQRAPNLEDFRKRVAEFGQLLSRVAIQEDLAEDIEEDFRAVERQANKASPNGNRIKDKLSDIVRMLENDTSAAGNVNEIMPGCSELAELAECLFTVVGQNRNTQATKRGVAAAGDIKDSTIITGDYNDYRDTERPANAEQAETIYREKIAERCGTLPLQSVDTSSAGTNAEPLSLAQVYIDLDTRRGTSALQAAIRNRRLVLLGDPGSGKSTFVNYLTHALAKGAWDCLPKWPKDERDALPIRVILREFARWVSEKEPLPKASPKLLWNFIVYELKEWNLDAVTDRLAEALSEATLSP